MNKIDYSKTVNLPKTSFSMKANLSQNEPQWVKFWQEKEIYKRRLEKNSKNKKFVLHDGPPYANGHIHIGHALNKILKDIVVKFKMLNGYYTPFIPGWDCHGLPIEYQLFKELKINKEDISQLEFRKKAKEYAEKFVHIQKDEFVRLGIFGFFDKPYLTMSPEYESVIVRTLAEIVDKGYIYRKKKPVYWCPVCETSLAEAEVEYEDKISDSIYVKFPVKKFASGISYNPENTYVLIWTTTPWTLPANLALAFNPKEKYVIAKNVNSNEKYIFLKSLLSQLEQLTGIKFEIESELPGERIALQEIKNTTICHHPFIDRTSVSLQDETVSTEEGTGIVHIAPGHGEEDYRLGEKYSLEIYSPVDNKGNFNEHIKVFEKDIFGEQVFKANKIIVEQLIKHNIILHKGEIIHSYPHCWRCKNPVIFRATEQWFLNVDHNELRKKLIDNIEKVLWVPEYGKTRISSMVSLRPDWCLSRQRYWGVPIPAVYCELCNRAIIKREILYKVSEIFAKEGSDSWFIKDITDFIPEGIKCECGSKKFRKETDILDVWYDSAVSFESVVKDDLGKVMYLEGSDQHRGWFQVALIVSSCIYNSPPYNTVLTHGFVVDGEGRKMSKSLGNVISPQEVIKTHGAEILRLWTASSDYSEDIRLSKEILEQLVDTYRKIRNTLRYILGNLYDFKKDNFVSNYEEYDNLDKYILSRLTEIFKDIISAYEEFKFYKVVSLITNFCIKDLSNFYFDILKDKLYTYKKDSLSRRCSQSVLYILLKTLTPVLAPILSFTAEEVWQEALKNGIVEDETVFFVDLHKVKTEIEQYRNITLDNEMKIIIELRDEVNLHLEKLRKEKIIGSSLETEVEITVYEEKYKNVVKKFESLLNTIFIVSSTKVIYSEQHNETKFNISAKKFDGIKCPRCWVYYKSLQPSGLCSKCEDALS